MVAGATVPVAVIGAVVGVFGQAVDEGIAECVQHAGRVAGRQNHAVFQALGNRREGQARLRRLARGAAVTVTAAGRQTQQRQAAGRGDGHRPATLEHRTARDALLEQIPDFGVIGAIAVFDWMMAHGGWLWTMEAQHPNPAFFRCGDNDMTIQ